MLNMANENGKINLDIHLILIAISIHFLLDSIFNVILGHSAIVSSHETSSWLLHEISFSLGVQCSMLHAIWVISFPHFMLLVTTSSAEVLWKLKRKSTITHSISAAATNKRHVKHQTSRHLMYEIAGRFSSEYDPIATNVSVSIAWRVIYKWKIMHYDVLFCNGDNSVKRNGPFSDNFSFMGIDKKCSMKNFTWHLSLLNV